MSIEIVLTLVVIGVIIAIAGVVYLHGHKAGVESAIVRATTIPSGVAAVLPSPVAAVAADAAKAAQTAATTAVADAAAKTGA